MARRTRRLTQVTSDHERRMMGAGPHFDFFVLSAFRCRSVSDSVALQTSGSSGLLG